MSIAVLLVATALAQATTARGMPGYFPPTGGPGATAKGTEVPLLPSASLTVRVSAAVTVPTATRVCRRPATKGPTVAGLTVPVRSETEAVPVKPSTTCPAASSAESDTRNGTPASAASMRSTLKAVTLSAELTTRKPRRRTPDRPDGSITWRS